MAEITGWYCLRFNIDQTFVLLNPTIDDTPHKDMSAWNTNSLACDEPVTRQHAASPYSYQLRDYQSQWFVDGN